MDPYDVSAWNMGGGPPQQPFPNYPAAHGFPPGIPPTGYQGYPQYGPPMGYPGGYPQNFGGPMPGYDQPGYPGGYPTMAPGQFPPGQFPPGQVQPGLPSQVQPSQPPSGQQQVVPQPSSGGNKLMQSEGPTYTPTLRPYNQFRPDDDCERLRKAMKGLGTDEKAIIDVLAHRTADQRAQLVQKFKTMYGKDLIKELKSELTGHFEDVAVAMCYPLDELDARELRAAMEGAGTDEDTLIEILCSRSNAQIRRIKEIYSRLFKGRDLEKDIKSETHGHFERILVSLSQGNRDESTHVDMTQVQADAKALYDAGEKRMGTDESTFNRILVSKSEAHVRAVIEAYSKISKRDLEAALKSEMSGDLLRCFLAVTRCIRNRPKYFAYRLKQSMEGLGTRDRHLIRLVVTRVEIDMADIKREFMVANKKSLESWISDDTTGDYKRMLLALIA